MDCSNIPIPKRVLTGSALKMIAILTMAIDHTASHLLRYQEAFTAPLITFHDHYISWYFLLRCVGRLAFPIFAFLIVEGFIHTHDRRRYGRNLLVCALISEIPWALTHHGFHLMGHNVIFTLFWGFLGLCVIERYRSDWRKVGSILVAMMVAAIFFRADYNASGFALIVMLYVLRRHFALQVLAGCTMLPMKWVAGLAFIPIAMYNGERGFIRGTWGKYLFYAFYPLHLLVIWMVKQAMGIG